jgi:hypothetical protein
MQHFKNCSYVCSNFTLFDSFITSSLMCHSILCVSSFLHISASRSEIYVSQDCMSFSGISLCCSFKPFLSLISFCIKQFFIFLFLFVYSYFFLYIHFILLFSVIFCHVLILAFAPLFVYYVVQCDIFLSALLSGALNLCSVRVSNQVSHAHKTGSHI